MNEATQRLFFALWPDAELQHALHRIGLDMQQALGGRAVQRQNIHLTLAFLGSVAEPRVEALRAIAAGIHTRRFQLTLAITGCWKRNGIAWIAPETLPAGLDALVLVLRESLRKAGFEADDKAFLPHVTLLRKTRCISETTELRKPLAWPVEQFALLRSETLQTGPVYSQIGAWPLQ